MFGNGNLFPGNEFPFPNFDVWKRKRVSSKQVSVARNENGFSVSTYLCCNGGTPDNYVFTFTSTIHTLSSSLN
jgi:hypothetical protein